ncbi:hypothetical protein KY084_02150 [Stakelama sp. CBK3Z-3]|uniref:TonB C-terminal domain-containing protein n=1 Tax=Stakelama flava TaxID=2860338 RepID=A0ABS6XHQ6_9SPHN|nr:hypothetical protein [Stakelama flava]MBW4329676.1 hypothetical protein [Stakelama flava]
MNSAIAFLVAAAAQQGGMLGLTLPIDWEGMTPLPYHNQPVVTTQMSQFVAKEMAFSKCPMPRRQNGKRVVSLDIAVLLSEDGSVRATIPRAINCSSVEQYSAGLVSTFARNNLDPAKVDPSGWYRATVTYEWQ